MKYKITKLQIIILKWIAKKIVIQSHHHRENIIVYYEILTEAARGQFTEDNKLTLDSFLYECHKQSLIKEEL